jgi:hypothetical protein
MVKRTFILFSVIMLVTILLGFNASSTIAQVDNPKTNEHSGKVLEARMETSIGGRGEIRCVQWYPDSPYASAEANASLEQLKAAIPGCNYLQLKCELNTTQDTVTALTNTSMLTDAMSTARQFGYKVILRVQMLRDARLFVPTNSDAWFASYGDVAKQYAILAKDHDVEGFCFATEFSLLEVPAYNSKWLNLIDQFREVYSGKLWYETNYWANKTGEFNSFEQKLNAAWFSELDYVAVSAYWELANATNPTVSDLVNSWHNYNGTRASNSTPNKPYLVGDVVETLSNLSQTFNKKILIVSGLASAEGACMTPYAYGSPYDNVSLSLEEQENWYEALFEVFQNKSWIAGYEFDGAWSTTPNITIKKDFFIQGKPAQDVVKTWFANHPPVTNFTYYPSDPTLDNDITFNASSTHDPDEDTISFTWDFDDGNISSTTLPIITHGYSVPRAYNVTLTVVDDEGLNSSFSLPVRVRANTSLSLWTSTTSRVVNLTVNINGILTNTRGEGLRNETINLNYSLVGSDNWTQIETCFTDDVGNYRAMWTPPQAEDFLIKAVCAGSDLHFGSHAIVALSILAYQQYVFSVQSNSTISDLAFDPNIQKLSFNTSGETGTASLTKITLDKSLIINASAITIHIDGLTCNYTSIELTDTWDLAFIHSHSINQIEVDLHAACAPSEIIVDDVNAVFVGTWTLSSTTSGYYGSGYRYRAAGTGANTATWSFNVPAAGSWQVYARWTSGSNRATNARYTVNYGAGSSVVQVNQKTNGGVWFSLGFFSFDAGTRSVVLSDKANGLVVIADAIRLVSSSSPVQYSLTVNVVGSGSVTKNPNQASYAPGTVVTLTANPAAGYVFSGWSGALTGSANPATITMNGDKAVAATFATPSSEIIVDDTSAVFVGTWFSSSSVSGYYGSGYRYRWAGTGSNKATWSFNIPQAGSWEVFARWTSGSNRATNAPYTVNHALGSTVVRANQEVNGGVWVSLGVYSFNAKAASIMLSDKANDVVIADAIRLVYVGS